MDDVALDLDPLVVHAYVAVLADLVHPDQVDPFRVVAFFVV